VYVNISRPRKLASEQHGASEFGTGRAEIFEAALPTIHILTDVRGLDVDASCAGESVSEKDALADLASFGVDCHSARIKKPRVLAVEVPPI
jgi:hypothetical protein